MAPNLVLFAKANKLGIEGFRQMSTDELTAAIAKAEGKAPAKGKTAPTAKGKAVTPAKGKSTPAKGKTTTAKPVAAKGKPAAAKKVAAKPAPAKGKPAAAKKVAAAKPAARSRAKAPTGAVTLDNKAIDWKAESNVGTTGKRKEVMDGLRKYKGDKSKVFTLLQPKARTFYKGKTKHDAERMLVWLIGRVAFDFALKSGQHTPGTRAAYGTSEAPQDIRRRELRGASKPAPARKTTAAKKSTAAKGKGKTSAARATARKTVAARKTRAASTRKTTAARKR